jgi:hypothetical protein
MAQILEENVLIKVSRLVKSSDSDATPTVTGDMVESLEAVVQELVGTSAVVEVTVVNDE